MVVGKEKLKMENNSLMTNEMIEQIKQAVLEKMGDGKGV